MKQAHDPGKVHRENEKAVNDTKRGAKIPLSRVVVDAKTKKKKRSRLKADLVKEMKQEEE